MVGKTEAATEAQRARMNAVSQMPCVACESVLFQVQPLKTEVHHIVDKGSRRASGGHDATIPLCGWHHRGITSGFTSPGAMRDRYGPSLALHKRDFVNLYGTERVLLERVNVKLLAGGEISAP